MTKASFSNDTDGKWIIGIAVAAIVLAAGYLANVSSSQHKAEPPQQTATQ